MSVMGILRSLVHCQMVPDLPTAAQGICEIKTKLSVFLVGLPVTSLTTKYSRDKAMWLGTLQKII